LIRRADGFSGLLKKNFSSGNLGEWECCRTTRKSLRAMDGHTMCAGFVRAEKAGGAL
jgi:hypothetical protein